MGTKSSVLIFEDEESIRSFGSILLTKNNYKAVNAKTGAERY